MKKYLSLFISISILISSLFACNNSNISNNGNLSSNNKKDIKIVTTIFPIYDWVTNILGDSYDKNNLTLLLNNSVDLHNYQPTSEDIIKISNCDLFIYVGGESDTWVQSVLNQVKNNNLKTINLFELLGNDIRLEEEKEGMEEDHEHEHDDEDNEDEEFVENHEEEHEKEFDEHVWLSLKNAKKLVSAISNVLQDLDENNKNFYSSNTTKYLEQLSSLDEEYTNAINNSINKMLIFGDRFPFLYMVKDYSLDYFAAFKGCSAETEASFKTIAFLSEKLNEYNLDYIITLENNNHKIAETVIENSNNKDKKILSLNSMQSITSNDIENGISYIDIMKTNLEVLKQALN